ncbi:MAG TPA: hypothetical protein VEV16_08930 [Daejeonella sp.]|nr:hypothetical protein [Daejeonella sp.]
MKKTFTLKQFLTLLCLVVISELGYAQTEKTRPLHVGFFYPISSNGVNAGEFGNTFSMHAFVGLSREEKALTMAGFSNIINDKATGLQMAGFSNYVRNKTLGVQMSGFTNTTGSLDGAQLSGFVNTSREVNGGQFAGFTNIATDVKGGQFSGFVNVANDVKGAQFAGFVNVARKVTGAQFSGFVNVADSSDYPVGLVNLIKNGEKAIGLTVDETQTSIMAFRSGGRVLYGIIGLGYNWKNTDQVYALEAGIGAHWKINNSFRINAEALSTTLQKFDKLYYFKQSVRVMPELDVLPGIGLFAGPSFNYVKTDSAEGRVLVKHYLHQKVKGDKFQGLYFGAVAGVHLKF